MPLTPAQADLAAEHFDVATWAAKRASWRWPGADRDDLLSWACEGLMKAAQQWDPDRGTTFVGYARMVIRSHIIDSWRVSSKRGRRGAVEFTFDHQEITHPDIIRASASVDLGFERLEDRVHAAATIETLELTERERYVLVELGSGTSLREIGHALGVDESRVCQIRKAIYDRLPVNGGRRLRRCVWCGTTFTPGHAGSRQVYCSKTCKNRQNKARVRCGSAEGI